MRESLTIDSRAGAVPMVTSRRVAAATIEYIVRFDTHQRLQHFLMMSSFIVLALTGFPQKFAELSLSQSFVSTLGGLETVRAIHRGAGFVMLSNCTYHVAYLLTRILIQKRYSAFSMVPQPRDALQALQMVRYFLGLTNEKPAFDRFSYLEKFDYWAVFWGIAMMGGSGLVLMFAVQVAHVAPGEIVPLAHTIHSDEALLAVSWIAIVHMFNAHLAPGIFPFNPAIFTGKLRKERYEHEHPLEYARITSTAKTATTMKAQSGQDAPSTGEAEGG
jgi:cytochrome b subunit of formate dehydrogenase